MQLTEQQRAEFHEKGFLIFPKLFTPAEVEVLRDEIRRLGPVETDHIVRERTGGIRTIFRVHEDDGPTQSAPFRALSRSSRLLAPAMQLLGDDDLYIYHSKVNTKVAIEGTVWLWHQDYGYWYWDGVPAPNLVTSTVLLDEATEQNGCLYIVPGSHKLGRQEPYADEETTSYKQWTIERERLVELLDQLPKPVALAGPPGTVAVFHCNVLHASGHNLSPKNRWQIYIVYNQVANRPNDVENPRPDYVRSVNFEPLRIEDDTALRAPLPVEAAGLR